jgi:hypothetical protein
LAARSHRPWQKGQGNRLSMNRSKDVQEWDYCRWAVAFVIAESALYYSRAQVAEIAPYVRLHELIGDLASMAERDPRLGPFLKIVDQWSYMLQHDQQEHDYVDFFGIPADELARQIEMLPFRLTTDECEIPAAFEPVRHKL